MSECPTLETDRLRLRPFVDDDVEAYFALYDTPEVRRSLHVADSFSATTPGPTLPSGEGNGRCAARASGHLSVETPGRYRTSRLTPSRTSRLAGSGDRLDAPPRPLGPRLRHRGRPSRGRLVLREPRRRRTRERDTAQNTASQAVARRLGFVCPRSGPCRTSPSNPTGSGGLRGRRRTTTPQPSASRRFRTLLRVMMQVNCRMRSRSKGIFRKCAPATPSMQVANQTSPGSLPSSGAGPATPVTAHRRRPRGRHRPARPSPAPSPR